jgi:hypothetical protein
MLNNTGHLRIVARPKDVESRSCLLTTSEAHTGEYALPGTEL